LIDLGHGWLGLAAQCAACGLVGLRGPGERRYKNAQNRLSAFVNAPILALTTNRIVGDQVAYAPERSSHRVTIAGHGHGWDFELPSIFTLFEDNGPPWAAYIDPSQKTSMSALSLGGFKHRRLWKDRTRTRRPSSH
jgi:hypothetical protein